MPLLQKAYLGATPLFAEKPWFYELNAKLVNASYSNNVTASSTIHTKGAWTQLIASTSAQASFLVVTVSGLNGNGVETSALIDIALGASGSESAIASNIAVGGAFTLSTAVEYPAAALTCAIPVSIASGTRISARIQALIASDVAVVSALLYNFGDASLMPSTVDVLGADTATSSGTAISANNSWTQIVSSTSKDYIGFCVVPSLSTNATNINANFVFQIGVGASGSEIAFGDFIGQVRSTEGLMPNDGGFFIAAREVPSGSRIAVRQDTSNSFFDATVIAIPKP